VSVSVSKKTDNIELRLTAYHNCDDVQLFWRTTVDGQADAMIPRCLGFKIERKRKDRDGKWGRVEVLRNRVGFSDGSDIEDNAAAVYTTKPSSIWPFQRYDWTDHGANNGQTVQYNIKAMRLPEGGVAGEVELLEIAESGWTEAIAVSANSENGISAYFNRGMVMSQYVARIIREKNWKPEDILPHIKELEDPLRVFLSGELRKEMLKIIGEVWIDPCLELYAALYELNDRELIDGLKLLRERAHILLANGSDKDHDENLMARGELIKANVDVRDRLLRGKGLGHNKFAVVVKDKENAIKAWTGSTNWSSTGLCTQLNNGILIEKEAIAKEFLEQWHRLDNAGNCFTKKLIDANDNSPRSVGIDANDKSQRSDGKVDVWFTPMHKESTENVGPDLQALIKLVNNAKHAILFVMFEPGEKSELVSSILEMSKKIYVRGVKNTVKNSKETFSLHEKGRSEEFNTPVIQPQGIEKGFSAWVDEITRKQFITTEKHEGIGHAITHAKMIVIDPLDEDCKVITGSHNFSKSASEKNDENFIVIHGNRPLAEACAVSCLATYTHYRWRAYLKEMASAGKKPWSHLSASPNWQVDYLTKERKRYLGIWCPQ
jgi:phosphatidylserine/phosphatidylglycerophosphate/cardiolipin synthase-like enzyme